ncbi:EAL domain-containing protein [Pontibacterium sp. N1Y112]|uniref:cyclic-guanylate-specific phosphodiesterase n=1 Tax=Pontibacterium sinense TaxID=2781979 RepID=A0A8J7JZQ8_9GAMM|nr:EAL domain-containing protein [Pontibacterium sinense]MBE9399093.1 EAL domain-containing protein [Pontibacterium sinense]
MKISQRLVILATSAVALSIALTGNMLWQDYQQSRIFSRLEDAYRVQTGIETMRAHLSNYQQNRNLSPLSESRLLYEELDVMLSQSANTLDQQEVYLQSLNKRNNSVCFLLDQMIRIHESGQDQSQTDALTHLSNLLSSVIQSMSEDTVRLEQYAVEGSKQLHTQGNLLTGGLLLALTLLLSGLSLRTAKLFKHRISVLDQGIRHLSEGDTRIQIEMDTGDEFSEVAHHFNQMTDRLQESSISRNQLQIEVERRTQELEMQKQALRQLADHDELTQLPNRTYFRNNLLSTIRKSERHGNAVAVLFMDLDKFKQINDSLGHNIGDEVLQEASRRFRDRLRCSDFVARLGGDEFTVIIEPVDNPQDVANIAQQLLQCMQQPVLVKQHSLHLGTSIGISVFPQDGKDVATLMRNADLAMYKAKENGGNRFHFYSEDMTQDALRKMSLEEELRQALQEDQLTVYYQPQYDLGNKKLVGVEALVRWNHPEKGLVAPMEFIPLAEERGLINQLGLQVLQKACTQCAQWLNEGFDPGILAVNISARQLTERQVPEQISQILKFTGWPVHRLELEVTESFFISDTQRSLAVLNQLRDMGIKLAIDDFGTGYSSLSYLKQLPISKLKIDRSFTRDLIDDAEDRAISEAIIALGKSLGLQVIAEGVELEGQADILIHEGCDQAQGYLYGKPMSAEQFSLLAAANPVSEGLTETSL